jgi:hypothetical protein
MKTRRLITGVILILAVLVFIGNYAIGEDDYAPTENEEIYGIWVNTDYGTTDKQPNQKIINNPDGTFERYRSTLDLKATITGTYTLTAKWTDSEGNIWYRGIWKYWEYVTEYELDKISKSGTVWEFVREVYDYPTKMGSDASYYFIFYLQWNVLLHPAAALHLVRQPLFAKKGCSL